MKTRAALFHGVDDLIRAWLPHAEFHEFYQDMHAIGAGRPRTGALVFATHSTHKLLAGISQASQIVVQDSENSTFDRHRFNEATDKLPGEQLRQGRRQQRPRPRRGAGRPPSISLGGAPRRARDHIHRIGVPRPRRRYGEIAQACAV